MTLYRRYKRPVQLLSLTAVVLAGVALMPSDQSANLVSNAAADTPSSASTAAAVAQAGSPAPKQAAALAPKQTHSSRRSVAAAPASLPSVGTNPQADPAWLAYVTRKPDTPAVNSTPAANLAAGVVPAKFSTPVAEQAPAAAVADQAPAAAPVAFPANANLARVGNRVLNVRSGPSTSSGRVFALDAGEQVAVIEAQGPWVRIQNGTGATGWVHSSYLIGSNLPKAAAVQAPASQPRQAPDNQPRQAVRDDRPSQPARQVRASQPTRELRADISRAEARPQQQEPDRPSSRLGRLVRVGGNAPVMSRPGASGDMLFVIPAGSRVAVAESRDGWTRVVTESGVSGWIRTR